jgi:hypothetical protein
VRAELAERKEELMITARQALDVPDTAARRRARSSRRWPTCRRRSTMAMPFIGVVLGESAIDGRTKSW